MKYMEQSSNPWLAGWKTNPLTIDPLLQIITGSVKDYNTSTNGMKKKANFTWVKIFIIIKKIMLFNSNNNNNIQMVSYKQMYGE